MWACVGVCVCVCVCVCVYWCVGVCVCVLVLVCGGGEVHPDGSSYLTLVCGGGVCVGGGHHPHTYTYRQAHTYSELHGTLTPQCKRPPPTHTQTRDMLTQLESLRVNNCQDSLLRGWPPYSPQTLGMAGAERGQDGYSWAHGQGTEGVGPGHTGACGKGRAGEEGGPLTCLASSYPSITSLTP